MDVNDFVLTQLPSPPARVLEVGCGSGELAVALARRGYDVLAIDPDAPAGPIFRQTSLEELDDPGPFDAAIAVRVLHHVSPLAPAVAKIARLAPLVIVDEFASERLDGRARDWYDAHRQTLLEPAGPPDLLRWQEEHPDLHASDVVLAALRTHFEERVLEWRPYFYRWLRSPGSYDAERTAVEHGLIPALGFRWVGYS